MLRHSEQWRFGVVWQNSGDGDGTGDGAGDGASGVGGVGASVGFGDAGAATGVGGIGDPGGAPAGTSTTGTGGFGAGLGGASSGDSAGSVHGIGGPSAAGVGPGVGVAGTVGPGGVGTGPGGIGGSQGGVSAGVGGIGGGSAAQGFGGGGFGGHGQGNNALGVLAASLLGVPPGVLTGVPTATTPIAVSNLAPPAQTASPALSQVAQQLAAMLGLSPTLGGQMAGGGASVGDATMGFPSLEGVSPGLGGFGANPASPGPSPAQTIAQNQAAEQMANVEALAQADMAGLGQNTLSAPVSTSPTTPAPTDATSTSTDAAPSQTPSPQANSLLAAIMSLVTGQPPLGQLAQASGEWLYG